MSEARGRAAAAGDPIVLSLMVQADMPLPTPARGPFSILVRHLLDRLLHSDSLGLEEESASRVIALAYAVALPGLLYALYLFPAYHMPQGKPPFWSQATDHLFYTAYGFTVMGLATVLEWDLLFPDLIDTLILSSLPIARQRLLLARVAALSIFFGGILLGTSLLGIIFLPLLSELPGMAIRQCFAHATAVLMCQLCAACSLIALQGIIVCVLGPSAARRISPVIQTGCVLVLLTSLFLLPLVSRFLPVLLQAHAGPARWFPPFWFLGIYEVVMHGSAAPALFVPLARTGVLMTIVAAAIAAITYPVAYARRVRQTVEGAGATQGRGPAGLFAGLLHDTVLRNSRAFAMAHWISQTIWRTQPTRLVLAVFGGLGFATTAAAVITLHPGHATGGPGLSPAAVRIAIPMAAFWTVAGLRAATRLPVSASAAWAFGVIHGRAKPSHLQGTEAWVATCSVIVTLVTAGVLSALSPGQPGTGYLPSIATWLFGAGIPILLTELFFLSEKTIPFTAAPPHSVNELSYLVLTWFLCFPVFVFAVAAWQPWAAQSAVHWLLAFAGIISAHIVLRAIKRRSSRHDENTLDMEADGALLPGEIGLRN